MTALFKKLNLKEHKSILVLNAPENFAPEMIALKPYCEILHEIEKCDKIDFGMVFVTQQSEIEHIIATIYPLLNGDAVLWFCYPKGSSKKYTCNFNRDKGWEALGAYNLEPVRQVSIDEDWSALRFRKVAYIKTTTRRSGFALSEAGKKKLNF